MQELIREFANDPGVRMTAALILLDFVLGVAAAFKLDTFRIAWLTDFLRNDLLGKVIPYFAVWAAVRLAGDVTLGGIGMIEEGVGAGVMMALGASVLNSVRDLGIWRSAPDEIAGSDQPPPRP